MTDGEALLEAIRAHPAEDAPRLMYADWLEEQGEPARAAFVRREVARAGAFEAFSTRKMYRSRACGQWHTRTHRNIPKGTTLAMRASLPPPDPGAFMRATFFRGFVWKMECSADWWLSHGDTVVAAHPVRLVELTSMTGAEQARVGARWVERFGPTPVMCLFAECWRDLWRCDVSAPPAPLVPFYETPDRDTLAAVIARRTRRDAIRPG